MTLNCRTSLFFMLARSSAPLPPSPLTATTRSWGWTAESGFWRFHFCTSPSVMLSIQKPKLPRLYLTRIPRSVDLARSTTRSSGRTNAMDNTSCLANRIAAKSRLEPATPLTRTMRSHGLICWLSWQVWFHAAARPPSISFTMQRSSSARSRTMPSCWLPPFAMPAMPFCNSTTKALSGIVAGGVARASFDATPSMTVSFSPALQAQQAAQAIFLEKV
mmetsp:Transcript_784/g.1501  ORF Transcript_784/g.1501 Transcript_784/m.1501 type:complete len:218 (-) Transcript_784:53-706(-)